MMKWTRLAARRFVAVAFFVVASVLTQTSRPVRAEGDGSSMFVWPKFAPGVVETATQNSLQDPYPEV